MHLTMAKSSELLTQLLSVALMESGFENRTRIGIITQFSFSAYRLLFLFFYIIGSE